MKRTTIGYIFNEKGLEKDEKIFVDVAKKKNINLVMINTAKDINEDELENKIKKCDIVYNNSAEDISFEIVKTIEALGKKVIDSSKALYSCEDKWMFFIKCKKNHIPTPKTILLSPNENIAKKQLKEFNCWPVILKRVRGTMGEFVDKAENPTQAERIIKKFWRVGRERLPIIAQEFIDSPSYRITVIGDKVIQTALKENKGWKATGVYAMHFKKFKADNELKKLIKKVVKASKIEICGIDLLKKNGKWLVLEVNSTPGLDFFRNDERRIIGEILNFLRKQAK
jgi:RimK family alpha-L-glutamate ligase